MCGICGQFHFRTQDRVAVADIVQMADTIAHRGPDDCGHYTFGSIGLGFRRLSIIDLEGGHQPMSDPEGTVWVIFNGEIYNFKEVRRELEAFGYKCRTNSDTEVIVHGYKQWGDDVLTHLNGMFGLAIWDVKKRRLMLARDRMGVKVVYYMVDSGRLLFGSEIRPIVAALPCTPGIDPIAVESFLRYRYTPSPRTIIQGIRKLAAGSRLIVEEGKEPKVERWWNFTPTPFDHMPSDREAEERLLAIYSAAVDRHLVSDVPVGLLLSGGLDSALLLALMSKGDGLWNTYTVGYGPSFSDDELQNAARTARILGSRNIPVEISCSVFENTVAQIASILEEPVATSSVVPMYYVCQRACHDVKVALIGQGPDELFGGYARHLGVNYGHYWRGLPEHARSMLKLLLGLLPRNESIKRALYSLDVSDRLDRYQQVFSIMSEDAVGSLLREDLFPERFRNDMPSYWKELSPLIQNLDELGGLQFLEIRSALPDELLLYADKISMAHSLELRVPYLDLEVVEYVERLAASFKVRYGTAKWLHRRVAQRFLPKEILHRKKKGFASNVVDEWFRDSLSKGMDGVFQNRQSLIYEYLRPRRVQQLLEAHKSRRADNHKVLFSLIILEHVLRKYGSSRKATPA